MIFAAYKNYEDASHAMTALTSAGIPADRISLVMAESARGLVPKVRSNAPEGAAVGGALGALAGGVAAVASLAIPGVGVLAAGPIVAAVGGSSLGAAGGGLAGALVGFGMREPEAARYAKQVMKNGFVLGVDPTNKQMADTAKSVFDKSRAIRLEDPDETALGKASEKLHDTLTTRG
jgi:hypothetical protein